MSTGDIFCSIRPKRGKYISEGKHAFGIVDGAPTAAVTAFQAATTKTKDAQAFGVSYRNPQGHFDIFLALAGKDVVDQIAACLPPDKIKALVANN
jgi:hypothetical protein